MSILTNYFVGLKNYDNINECDFKPSIIHEYISETTQGYGKLFMLTNNESFVFNGQIINGKMSGQSYIKFINDKRYPDYKSYEGNLLNGLFHGTGKIIYMNGDIFIGNFINGLKNGSGKMYNGNGQLIMDNIWKDDVVSGKINYNEHYYDIKQIKISGVLFNSIKVGPWTYYGENGIPSKIEYYKDYELSDTSDTSNVIICLEKEIITHESGYITKQIINPSGEKYSLEDLCLLNFQSYKYRLWEKSITNNIVYPDIYNTNIIDIYHDEDIKKYAIPLIHNNETIKEKTLIKYLNNKGEVYLITEYINGKFYDKIICNPNIPMNKNNKFFKTFLVNNNTYNESTLTVDIKSSIYVIDDNMSDKIKLYLLYEGNMQNGFAHGNGNMYNKNGIISFSGVFEKGQLINGVQYNNNSNVTYMSYNGTFKDNIPHGEGSYFNKNGIKLYEGQINEDKYHGDGISYWDTTGIINWEGKWKNQQKHGKGRLYDDNGSLICICSFENDQMSFIE